MPQWKLKKMAEEEERKKPVIEKSFRVILEGLKTELKTFQEIKTLTDGEKITPNKTFLEENVILEYRQKKHALKACHVLCDQSNRIDVLVWLVKRWQGVANEGLCVIELRHTRPQQHQH